MRDRLRRSGSLGVSFGVSALLFLAPTWALGQTQNPGEQAYVADEVPPPLPTEPELAEQGFEFGLGTGLALPFGNADSGASLFDTGGQAPNSGLQVRDGTMSGLVSYRVPLVLDAGYRVSPTWYLGARAEAATGWFGTECPDIAKCSWTDARFGALAKYHFAPTSHTDPWLGIGLGWEWLRSSASFLLPPEVTGLQSNQGVTAKQTIGGPLLELLGGLAFDWGQHIHAGPFASAAVGRYVRSSFDCPSAALGCPAPSWIDDGAFHAWLSLGISGTHGP